MHRKLRTVSWITLVISCATFAIARQSQSGAPAQTVQTQQSGNSQAQEANEALSPQSTDRLIREVRHALVMLPYYGVFDNLAYRVDGSTITLEGQVVRPVLKSDAESAVKRIEGVEKVVNKIEVLPPSSVDDRIRRAEFQQIYGFGPLVKYSNMAVPPIHIIVKNGRVTLEGVVDSEADKNLVGIRANQVPGTFQVTNNLRVVGGNSEKK